VLIKIGVGNANLKNNSVFSVSLWLKKGAEVEATIKKLFVICGSKKMAGHLNTILNRLVDFR